jgi:predicted metalloprotease with PDZ domain
MKKFTLLVLVLFSGFSVLAQTDPQLAFYEVSLDLIAVHEDRLPVEIKLQEKLSKNQVEYHLPRIIPGTYDIHDYGRFISEFQALDHKGEALPVERLDTNRWLITEASRLAKIKYLVDDTYDADEKTGIFEPAGTSHDSGEVYLLNNFGYVGYLHGYQNRAYKLEVRKPQGFYGGTALTGQRSDTLDHFLIADYFSLHDNPILYAKPDTASMMIGETRLEVSLYSSEGKYSATKALESMAPALTGAGPYLGGQLPVDKYAVLIYLVPFDMMADSYGALEHHRSTVLYMPELPGDFLSDGIRDITAHEFFHIVTPLRIHSEQVHNFDFIEPEMSRHLWLYEGVTEYNSHLVQVRSGIYSIEKFLAVMQDKMLSADDYDQSVPLTMASRHTLSYFKEEYLNFYDKGALAGMALDLKLRSLSDEGNEGLIDLLQELGKVYHADTFFNDQELFSIIGDLTAPELEEFLVRHYAGTSPFPFQELMAWAGIIYEREGTDSLVSLGSKNWGFNFESQRLFVPSESAIDEFGEALGLRAGDEIISIGGVSDWGYFNLDAKLSEYRQKVKAGETVEVVIARPKRKAGDFKQKALKAKARLSAYDLRHKLELMDNPTPEQLAFRKAWLGQR